MEAESQPFLLRQSTESIPSSKWPQPTIKSIKKGRWIRHSSRITSHCAVFIATSLVWGCILVVALHFSPRSSKQARSWNTSLAATEVDYLTCGSSAQEAKDKGCKYDILDNLWIPSECVDEASIEEYQSDGSWLAFADENMTQPLAKEDLGDLKVYYTSNRDHIVHCSMLWKRQYRAFSEGWQYIDSLIANGAHTKHCAEFLVRMGVKGPNWVEVPTTVHVGFGGCHVRGI